MDFLRCPRCGTRGFEQFSVYGYCHDCNYVQMKKTRRRPISEKKLRRRVKNYKLPHPFRTSLHGTKNQFTEEDHQIVRKVLLSIPEKEQKIVFLHFWKDRKKSEIAERFRMTEEQVDQILAAAFERLRSLCLRHPQFSRALRMTEVEMAA